MSLDERLLVIVYLFLASDCVFVLVVKMCLDVFVGECLQLNDSEKKKRECDSIFLCIITSDCVSI